MISSKELRIGNWFFDSELGGVKVHEILFASTWVVFKHMNDDYEITESRKKIYNAELSPIPLTPEILLACGFMEIDGIGNTYFKGLYSLRKQKEKGKYNNYVFYIHWDLQFARLSSISYLHQLQNIFFVLTGIELEYVHQKTLTHE